MAEVFIALGSNLGSRHKHMADALEALQDLPESRIVCVSSFHETAPVGGPPQGTYLNAVAKLETSLPPQKLFSRLQAIETLLGRPERHEPGGPRTIDLDLLSDDNLVLDSPRLTLPHPRLHTRGFVLAPLVEIAPHWVHPVLGRSSRLLLEALACGS